MSFMVPLIPSGPPSRLLFALAGQSNMVGQGNLGQLPTFPYAHKVFNYANDGVWKQAAEPIDSAVGQIDSVSADVGAAASSGCAFGNALVSLRPRITVGLIPCAKGSSTIASWQRSGTSRATLYGSMLARINEARAQGVFGGLIFYQGEQDAASSSAASNWAASFLAIYDNLCADLVLPNMPAIVTELAPDPGTAGAYWATVQAQQRGLHGARDGNIACVSAADLTPISGDPVHIDTTSLVTLGQRYAVAMHGLLGA